ELMALGLAGCTAMDVISILTKMRQEVTGFQVQVHPTRTDRHPTVWTKVHIEYLITGKEVDPKTVERAIDLSSTTYCPAQNMLDENIEIVTTYEIFESDSVKTRTDE
ncbi:MAG: OsmC family protein, partial [Chloroflexota bacterium]